MTETSIQWHIVLSLQVIDQIDDVKCTLASCAVDVAAKYECDHQGNAKRIVIRLKMLRQADPASTFSVEHISKSAPVCDVASREDESIVLQLTVHAAANVIELFVHTLLVLQTT